MLEVPLIVSMKKNWFLILVLSVTLLVSCDKKNSDSEKHPLKNTKWMCQMHSTGNLVLDFVSETDVKIYYINSSRILIGEIFNATYAINNSDSITFQQADPIKGGFMSDYYYYLLTGTFTERFMLVKYQEEDYRGDIYDREMTLAKE
jgi:hypothetical protein